MAAARRKRRQTKRKKLGINELTKGQVNKILDVIFHRHFRRNPDLILLDGLAHAIVENDLKQSLRKFAKYSVPALLKETERKKTGKRKRRGKGSR